MAKGLVGHEQQDEDHAQREGPAEIRLAVSAQSPPAEAEKDRALRLCHWCRRGKAAKTERFKHLQRDDGGAGLEEVAAGFYGGDYFVWNSLLATKA